MGKICTFGGLCGSRGKWFIKDACQRKARALPAILKIMKHLFPILIILLTLASCTNKTKQGIEGVWLGYERTFVLNNDTTDDNFHLILSIDKDSIQTLNFKFITSGNRDSISNSSYILSGNSLIVARNSESDTFGIDVLNETTLVLSTSKNKFKYTKLRKALTKEWNFDCV